MKSFTCVLIIALFGFAASQWTVLQPAEYENDQSIIDNLNFGSSFIIRDAVDRGVLPDGEYHIAAVYKVEKQVTVNGTDDRFNLEIDGPRGARVNGNVTVTVFAANGTKGVTDYFYTYLFNRLNNEEGEVGEVSLGEFDNTLISSEESEFSWDWFDFEGDGNELADPTVLPDDLSL